MKKALFLLCSFLTLATMGCEKDNNDDQLSTQNDDLYKNSPRSEVPAELAPATWSYGTISAIGYYNDYGNHVGNAYSAAREYKVTKDGYYEFAQFLSTEGATSSCINEYFTHLKGTVKFEGNKLTFYPVEGSFRTVKTSRSTTSTSCTLSNTKRTASKEELKELVSSYYWKTVTIEGDMYLQVFNIDDPDMQDVVFSYSITK
jgi:Chaperone for protein-folding within the ER, fungal